MTFTERHCIECDVSSVFRYRDIFNCASGLECIETNPDVPIPVLSGMFIQFT